MPLSVVVGLGLNNLWVSGLTYVNTVGVNPQWCFLFPWFVVSIEMYSYWWGYIWAIGLQHCVILRSLGQRMLCKSNQMRWNCLWMPRCVTPVPVVGWSCIFILPMLGILGGSAWVSRATLMEISIAMLGHCCCSHQFHIHRRLAIVLLMVWQRPCCLLGLPWWWHIGVISSIVGDLGDSIFGAVAVPIVSLSSLIGVACLIIIVLVVWHFLHYWSSQSMIPVYLF